MRKTREEHTCDDFSNQTAYQINAQYLPENDQECEPYDYNETNMLAIIADTYMESYGSENYLFRVYNSEDECINFMTNYNKLVLDFFEEFQLIGKEPEAIWETDDINEEEPKNIEQINKYHDKLNTVIKKYQELGIVVGDTFFYNDCSTLDNLFRFDLDNYDKYIKILDNSKPLYIGGYCE